MNRLIAGALCATITVTISACSFNKQSSENSNSSAHPESQKKLLISDVWWF